MTDPKTYLAHLHQNLALLREREAKYAGNAPLDLLNQLTDHRQAIGLTERVIAGELSESAWREALRPLLVAIARRGQAEEGSRVDLGNVGSDIIGAVITGGIL